MYSAKNGRNPATSDGIILVDFVGVDYGFSTAIFPFEFSVPEDNEEEDCVQFNGLIGLRKCR